MLFVISRHMFSVCVLIRLKSLSIDYVLTLTLAAVLAFKYILFDHDTEVPHSSIVAAVSPSTTVEETATAAEQNRTKLDQTGAASKHFFAFVWYHAAYCNFQQIYFGLLICS